MVCILFYIIPFAPAMPLFHGDSGTPYGINQQNSPTTNNLHSPLPLSLQFEAQQTQLHTIALNIFHEEQVLAAVIIVLSIILFCSSLIEMHKSDVFDGQIWIRQ